MSKRQPINTLNIAYFLSILRYRKSKLFFKAGVVLIFFATASFSLLLTGHIAKPLNMQIQPLLITLLLGASISQKAMKKQEETFDSEYLKKIWVHIGKLNLLNEKLKETLLKIDAYPQSKRELAKILSQAAEKIIGIVGCPWIIVRIIDTTECKTIAQYEHGKIAMNLKLANRSLLRNEKNVGQKIVPSSIRNAKIKAYCIFPKIELRKEQNIFTQKIIDDLTMIYALYYSTSNTTQKP